MKNFEALELVTSVDLGYTETKTDKRSVYQFVYGSQLYGTLFGVFAKFGIDDKTNGEVVINEITLKILNYQGLMNIGFTHHELFCNEENKNIYFGLQAGNTRDQKNHTFIQPITVQKDDRFQLIFNRILYPLVGFEFDIEKRRKNDEVQEPLDNSVPSTLQFDPEFQYRSGIDYYNRVLRPGMLGYKGISMEGLELVMPSGRCHTSNVNLYS